MLVKRIEFQGLQTISEGFVRRVVKTRASQPYTLAQVQEDVRALLRTRKFVNAQARTRVEDNEVVVTFLVAEKPEIRTIELEGNKRYSDTELYPLLPLPNTPLDRYEVNRGREAIERKYKAAGHYYITVVIDEAALSREGRVVYRITEGPRVTVRHILIEGNRTFAELRLRTKIQTRTYLWIFRVGAFDEELADRDAIALQSFYRDQGYLDARVGYRPDFDDVDRTRLTLVFVIEEGPRYTVREVQIEGHTAFDADRIRAVMQLQRGSPLREDTKRLDIKKVEDLYGQIGYVDAVVRTEYQFFEEEPGVVNLRYIIAENKRSRFGRITIRGNVRTKDHVVRRELRFYPGEDYNTVKAREAEQHLLETGLFQRAEIKPLEDADGFREALVEIEEADTVTFQIGAGISTDSGVLGTITIENRNFDLFDRPRTWGEFFRGQSLRGAGQRIRVQLEPGTQVSRFRIDFTEPYLFDRPLRLDTSVYLFQRGRDGYDEQRLGFVLSLGKRFESGALDGWAIEGSLRLEGVKIDNVDPLASRQIRDVRGDHTLTAIKAAIVHDTTDSRLLPSRGYRLSFSWEQVGALGGDFTFSRPAAGFEWYKTIRTDVFDRKSILGMRADIGFIAGDAPVFERFYGGGFGSIRGFTFRGISPRAGVFDNAVGGDFITLLGAEYSFPVYGKNVRGVTFLDMGTVEENFEIKTWRASVGFGLRVTIDFFGPVPMVFDFGFPISEHEEDSTRVFNFSVGASW